MARDPPTQKAGTMDPCSLHLVSKSAPRKSNWRQLQGIILVEVFGTPGMVGASRARSRLCEQLNFKELEIEVTLKGTAQRG